MHASVSVCVSVFPCVSVHLCVYVAVHLCVCVCLGHICVSVCVWVTSVCRTLAAEAALVTATPPPRLRVTQVTFPATASHPQTCTFSAASCTTGLTTDSTGS